MKGKLLEVMYNRQRFSCYEMPEGNAQIPSKELVMPILTNEEAESLDEELTCTVPKLTNVEGPFIKNYRRSMLVALDQLSAQYLQARMIATKKTPTEIISEMVREKIDATG